MNPDALHDIKHDCEHDEAFYSTRSPMTPTCFWDDRTEQLTLLNGAYLCPTHAVCHTCRKTLTTDALTCRCDKYGSYGHEELLWCSEQCLEHAHPDWEPSKEEETTP